MVCAGLGPFSVGSHLATSVEHPRRSPPPASLKRNSLPQYMKLHANLHEANRNWCMYINISNGALCHARKPRSRVETLASWRSAGPLLSRTPLFPLTLENEEGPSALQGKEQSPVLVKNGLGLGLLPFKCLSFLVDQRVLILFRLDKQRALLLRFKLLAAEHSLDGAVLHLLVVLADLQLRAAELSLHHVPALNLWGWHSHLRRSGDRACVAELGRGSLLL